MTIYINENRTTLWPFVQTANVHRTGTYTDSKPPSMRNRSMQMEKYCAVDVPCHLCQSSLCCSFNIYSVLGLILHVFSVSVSLVFPSFSRFAEWHQEEKRKRWKERGREDPNKADCDRGSLKSCVALRKRSKMIEKL